MWLMIPELDDDDTVWKSFTFVEIISFMKTSNLLLFVKQKAGTLIVLERSS